MTHATLMIEIITYTVKYDSNQFSILSIQIYFFIKTLITKIK